MDKLPFTVYAAIWHRRAFTLIEVTIAAAILAIGSAVILPRWSQSVERTRINNMRRCVETNVAMLRRLSVRTGQEFNLAFTADSAQMTIAPAVPHVLGDAAGVVDYADRFPGISFTAIDFNGNNALNVSLYGELVSVYSGQTLDAGILTIASDSTTQTIDLLAAQGKTSIPTQPDSAKEPLILESLAAPLVEEVIPAAKSESKKNNKK